jgi:hypothetical protein
VSDLLIDASAIRETRAGYRPSGAMTPRDGTWIGFAAPILTRRIVPHRRRRHPGGAAAAETEKSSKIT